MHTTAQIRQRLIDSLHQRQRPEEVAAWCGHLLHGILDDEDGELLGRAVLSSSWYGEVEESSMTTEFSAVVGFTRQLAVAGRLFGASRVAASAPAGTQLAQMEQQLPDWAREIHASAGAFDFKADRLNRTQRAARGSELSRRQYNKRFRFLRRLERKVQRVERRCDVRVLTMIGKSRLASTLTAADFEDADSALAFVAYYTARSNLRSEFTIAGQKTALDEIAEMLYSYCERNGPTRWWPIALAYPAPRVVAQLSPEEQGRLLARWFGVLSQSAGLLRTLWTENQFRRDTMIVARGNDSTTWNQVAGAWNRAREAWFALLEALGATDVVAGFCPGKVMRLMAADVAAWHRAAGGDLDAQTNVWAELPPPWEVVSGDAECTRAQVELICGRHRIDPVKSGWTRARRNETAAPFQPTPELVHGVTVASPELARILRRAGVFSGRA